MARESPLVIAGTITSVVALSYFIFLILSLVQYFCFVDFLKWSKTLIFIKVLYYNNPQCSTEINIGRLVPEMESQAFVFTRNEPLTTTRTIFINVLYLPLTMMWLLSSLMLIFAGANNIKRMTERGFWMLTTAFIIMVDTIVLVIYATDIDETMTSSALVRFAGATLSGAGNVIVDTKLVATSMVVLYGRCGIFYVVNFFLICWILHETGRTLLSMGSSVSSTTDIIETGNSAGVTKEELQIPRVGFLKRLPTWLIGVHGTSPTFSYEEYEATNRPKRLTHIMAERRRQLESSVVDTSLRSPVSSVQELPEPFSEPTTVEIHAPPPAMLPQDHAGRRGTAAELQGQLPWSYIPPSAHRMRDNLPEDEDLPPVPVPDYTLHPKYRKASLTTNGSPSRVQLERNEPDDYIGPYHSPGVDEDVDEDSDDDDEDNDDFMACTHL